MWELFYLWLCSIYIPFFIGTRRLRPCSLFSHCEVGWFERKWPIKVTQRTIVAENESFWLKSSIQSSDLMLHCSIFGRMMQTYIKIKKKLIKEYNISQGNNVCSVNTSHRSLGKEWSKSHTGGHNCMIKAQLFVYASTLLLQWEKLLSWSCCPFWHFAPSSTPLADIPGYSWMGI